MAFAVEKWKVGSLVWVQRKNGTWWPGKIEFTSLTSRVAVKLLGRETGSVFSKGKRSLRDSVAPLDLGSSFQHSGREWFNSEKSERIKAFRSVEFDGFIRRVESSETSQYKKSEKYARREVAVLHALLLEKQEQEKCHKRPVNMKQGARRAKRSRCTYLPVESNNYVKHSLLHSQSLKVPSMSCETEEQSWSASTVSDTFQRSFNKSDSDGDSKLKGSYAKGRQTRIRNVQKKESISNAGKQNWNLKEKCYSQESCGTPDTVVTRKQAIIYKSDSTSRAENSGSESLCYGPVYTNIQNENSLKTTLLVDVNVTVQASYRKEQVPLVSLMSKLSKVAIIGHPIEVEPLESIPEDSPSRKGSNGTKICQLVWRTSKRTPVSYIPIHNSSPTSNPEATESLLKPLKEGNFSLKHGHDLPIKGQVSQGRTLSFTKRAGKAACVPVNLVFSKLFSAIST